MSDRARFASCGLLALVLAHAGTASPAGAGDRVDPGAKSSDLVLQERGAAEEPDPIARARSVAALSDEDPALRQLAGANEGFVRPAGTVPAIARVRLALQEPRVRARLPGMAFTVSVDGTSERYERVGAGTFVVVHGESVSFRAIQEGRTLVERQWSTSFPETLSSQPWGGSGPPRFVGAHVSELPFLEELFRLPVFTQADLTELTRSELPEVRAGSVRNLTDQAVLEKIVREDRSQSVRHAAAGRITDQGVLAGFVLGSEDPHIREGSLAKLTDQAALAKVALEHRDWRVRQAAVDRLTDEAALARVASADRDGRVLEAAVARIADQSALAKIAIDGAGGVAAQAATRKLKDQGLLARLAVEEDGFSVRLAAVERLEDQEALARVVLREKDAFIRKVATLKLTDGELLRRIAARDADANVRSAAEARRKELAAER